MAATTPITSAGNIQELSRQIATKVDSNKDGQITTAEFSTFIASVFDGIASGSTRSFASGVTAPASLGFTPEFWGFDESRAISAAGSLKYDAYRVLHNYDPRDPLAMRQAFVELNALHPGMYELDAQDNLMLTGTADGYIGARPVNRESDWNNRNQAWVWQWHGYNVAHPGPNGEIT